MKFLSRFFRKKPKIERTDIEKRFDLIARLGQGSMSKVWRALDRSSGKLVALKVLDKEKTLRYESRFTDRFKPSEGEVAVQLIHPHIVRTYEFGRTLNNEQFLVMELIDGYGLSYLVDMQNDFMREHRLRMIVELGEAIQYFHHQKWIHRDICPRNVLLDKGSSVKLIDFGLVVPNTPAFQEPGNRTGTANYMAPELVKRLHTDQRIDIYSFAVTCYEMYTKEYPWGTAATTADLVKRINQPGRELRELVPDVDEQVAKTIMRGLELDPKDRWSSITEMLQQFREARVRLKDPTLAKPPRERDEGPKRPSDDFAEEWQFRTS